MPVAVSNKSELLCRWTSIALRQWMYTHKRTHTHTLTAPVTELYLLFKEPLAESEVHSASWVSWLVHVLSPTPQIRHVQLAIVRPHEVRHVAIWAPVQPPPGVTARVNGVIRQDNEAVACEGMCALRIDDIFNECEIDEICRRADMAVVANGPYAYSRYACTLLPAALVGCLVSDTHGEPVICSGLVARLLPSSMFPVPSAQSPASVFREIVASLKDRDTGQQIDHRRLLRPRDEWTPASLAHMKSEASRICEQARQLQRQRDEILSGSSSLQCAPCVLLMSGRSQQ